MRVPSNPAPPSPTHFELKTMDASVNPYLALGSAIAAGFPGEPVAVDPGYLAPAQRRDRGIDLLPTS
ncbi:hypothetical protein [Phormidium sp. CCY1219]|uniref:hypothetical protein n=1 Tax=Phormidium sp. CCY1219 TaxID=2886104 RepID=UPI002D787C8C|nr:hypothetical protein [Phormidium sp. CCY1219]